MNEKIKLIYLSLTKLEKTDIIKKQSIRLNKLYKSFKKATASEIEYNGDRKGVRGGKFCSLSAKSDNCAIAYQQCEEELKFMINNL